MDPEIREWKAGPYRVRALYRYNEKIRSLLFQYKGCFDIELSDIFLCYQAPYLRLLYPGYTLVPAPSFLAKDEARGFNHVELMFKPLQLPFCHCLEKLDDVKQANNTYEERQHIGEHLRFKEGFSVQGKKILFVDDLFTTGATAKACCHLLEEHGAKKVQILVMGYTPENRLGDLKKEIPLH
jgi:competence protein ComFC